MKIKLIVPVLLFGLIAGCSKKDDVAIDTEYPTIDISSSTAFPIQCSEISRGEKLVFKAKFSDNSFLGTYSLDIHHNFDHHTHSTEVAVCTMNQVKTAVKPFLFINTFDIPVGTKSYEATNEILIPSDIDPGDYHFMIKLTDKEGWQTLKGISIKIK
jgi:hypothetical protein